MAFDTNQPAYREFRAIVAERSDAIVAWIGAGLSVRAGLPAWRGLRDMLIQDLRSRIQYESDEACKAELNAAVALAEAEQNLWNSFSLLKEKLGTESYRAAIRRAISPSETISVPEVYKTIWKMGISGILSLNIDRLAARAFNEIYGGKALHTFTGENAGGHAQVLRATLPWLVNLHGVLEDASSWVFTSNDLRRLCAVPGYQALVRTCFLSRTVVFMGISADDVAASGHLEQLTKSGVDCGGHFWITHLGADKRRWAEEAGIKIICYHATGNDHSEFDELVRDLKSFKPKDDIALPVVAEHIPQTTIDLLPDPKDLVKLPSPEIRNELNAYASLVLEKTSAESVERFEEFAKQYSEAIYRAWYVDLNENSKILSYKLTEKQADGAFGTVYRAEDSSGQNYAVKILHERIRNNSEMLQSFRRGIRSMRILANADLPGVVGYFDASEIPAMVVMEFVEGINLSQAVEMRVLAEWSRILSVATDLTDIIRASHKLPQRVLHRDIRPANVMLENCWGPDPDWEDVNVRVLDFDLSYHLDAFDVSVSSPGHANGFLAPEQADRTMGVSTRNAAVDSFGLGMTLYYLGTGVEPRFAEHRYENWKSTLEAAAIKNQCDTWRSLPRRYFRTVRQATFDKQELRLDMAGIQSELTRLCEALRDPKGVRSAELLAEELACRAFGEYEWERDKIAAVRDLGVFRVKIVGDESELNVACEFDWLQTDNRQYDAIRKWLPRAQESIESTFRKAGWKGSVRMDTGQLHGKATITVDELRQNLGKHVAAIEAVLGSLALS